MPTRGSCTYLHIEASYTYLVCVSRYKRPLVGRGCLPLLMYVKVSSKHTKEISHKSCTVNMGFFCSVWGYTTISLQQV